MSRRDRISNADLEAARRRVDAYRWALELEGPPRESSMPETPANGLPSSPPLGRAERLSFWRRLLISWRRSA